MSAIATVFLDDSTDGMIAFGVYLSLTVAVYTVIAFQGFKIQAFASILIAVAVVGLLLSVYMG